MIKWIICATLIMFAIIKAEAGPLKVLMIDSGTPYAPTNLLVPGSDVSITSYVDDMGHASAVYQMIVSGQSEVVSCPSIRVDWCTFYMGKETEARYYYHCLAEAVKGNYDLINLSLESRYYSIIESNYINKLRSKSIVIVASGNDGCLAGLHKCHVYPAAHSKGPTDSVRAISALDKLGRPKPYSNTDPNGLTIDFLGEGYYSYRLATRFIEGTSMAAALYTNKLIKDMCGGMNGKR